MRHHTPRRNIRSRRLQSITLGNSRRSREHKPALPSGIRTQRNRSRRSVQRLFEIPGIQRARCSRQLFCFEQSLNKALGLCADLKRDNDNHNGNHNGVLRHGLPDIRSDFAESMVSEVLQHAARIDRIKGLLTDSDDCRSIGRHHCLKQSRVAL